MPVAIILVALALVVAMRWPRQIVKVETVQVAADRSPSSATAWRPVTELRPRIIRSNQ